MKGHSNHKKAIAQIAVEMNIDEATVMHVCDRIISPTMIQMQMRYPFSLHLPSLGSFSPTLSKAVRLRKAEVAIYNLRSNDRKKKKRKYDVTNDRIKQPEEVPAKEFYFDLEYLP